MIGTGEIESSCTLGDLPYGIDSICESRLEKSQWKITIAMRRNADFIFKMSNLGRVVQGWVHAKWCHASL